MAFADRILVNKIDLVSDPSDLLNLEQRIREINSRAVIIRCHHGRVDVTRPILHPDATQKSLCPPLHPTSTVSTVSIKFFGALSYFRVERFFYSLLTTVDQDQGSRTVEVFRYKGVLSLKNSSEKYVLHGVRRFSSGGPGLLWDGDEVLPGENRVVFIGKNLCKKTLLDSLQNCKAEETLRFAVGDVVEVFTDKGWQKGLVLKLWDML